VGCLSTVITLLGMWTVYLESLGHGTNAALTSFGQNHTVIFLLSSSIEFGSTILVGLRWVSCSREILHVHVQYFGATSACGRIGKGAGQEALGWHEFDSR